MLVVNSLPHQRCVTSVEHSRSAASARCSPKGEDAECPSSVSRGAEARAIVSFIRLFDSPGRYRGTSSSGTPPPPRIAALAEATRSKNSG